MKSLLPTFFVTLLIFSLPAQITNTAPATSVRMQSVVKREGVSLTNGTTQAGVHVIKSPEHFDEFIGTLLSVDKEKQAVSIALGPPFLVNQVKAKSFGLAPETKFFTNESPARLDDGVVGEAVHYRLRIQDGKQFLTILRFLPDFNAKGNK
jgi:hypothetical protein